MHSARDLQKNEVTYHSRQNSLQYRTQNIEHITGEPNNNELQTQSISGASPEILNNLRREDNNPASDWYWTIWGVSLGTNEENCSTNPQIPLMAVISKLRVWDGGTILALYKNHEHKCSELFQPLQSSIPPSKRDFPPQNVRWRGVQLAFSILSDWMQFL